MNKDGCLELEPREAWGSDWGRGRPGVAVSVFLAQESPSRDGACAGRGCCRSALPFVVGKDLDVEACWGTASHGLQPVQGVATSPDRLQLREALAVRRPRLRASELRRTRLLDRDDLDSASPTTQFTWEQTESSNMMAGGTANTVETAGPPARPCLHTRCVSSMEILFLHSQEI
ncbi:hypothetical protein NDU88_005440 [Pleurodeles waltl]|uniref:Uncharacterized protein n=1 Tax=Pleurodeles waltl TaxID=8319 RepID=A0AAV7WBG1_PLEWA|nr:hypothetical protein NDU88_005440 [Pleurodeles waltl]